MILSLFDRIMPHTIVLNYTNPTHVELFNALVHYELSRANPNQLIAIREGTLYKFPHQGNLVRVIFPLAAFQYKRDTDEGKPIVRMALYEPFTFDSGSFGGVHYVIALYKHSGDTFKIKRADKTYVAKESRLQLLQENTKSKRIASYKKEQEITSQVPHLRAKYKPSVVSNDNLLLLMRQIEGKSLRALLAQIHKGTFKLSVSEYLKLSLNLFVALKEQAHELNIITNDTMGHIIHRDIKPANLMVTEDLEIKLIDYGLSVNSANNNNTLSGTHKYMEPQLAIAHDEKIKVAVADEISDLYSAAITVGELLGVTFIANNKVELTNLFHGMAGVTQDERETIQSTLTTMTRFARNERLNHATIIEVFQRLLNNRLQREQHEIRNLRSSTIEALSAEQLFTYLQSDSRGEFLAKLQDNKPLMQIVAVKLKPIIHLLSPKALSALANLGMQLEQYYALNDLILNGKIEPERIMGLYSLGAALSSDLLKKWLEEVYVPSDECSAMIYWIKVCRILVKSAPESKQIVSQAKFNSPYKQVFCQYLIDADHYLPSTCYRLVSNHLFFIKHRNIIIADYNNYRTEQALPASILDCYEHYIEKLISPKKLLITDKKLDKCIDLNRLFAIFHEWYAVNNKYGNAENNKRSAVLNEVKLYIEQLVKSLPPLALIDAVEIKKQTKTLKVRLKSFRANVFETRRDNISEKKISVVESGFFALDSSPKIPASIVHCTDAEKRPAKQ